MGRERHFGLAVCLSTGVAIVGASPVTKIVVLMMENRSFDHLLGWLTETCPDIDGLTGSESNYEQPDDVTSTQVFVSKDGYDMSPYDPDHSLDGTDQHIYGLSWQEDPLPPPSMDGFVWGASTLGETLLNPMSMFTSEDDSAPIINTLATEFAVFDKWYASAPTSTDPNRALAMSGTSQGITENFNGTLWPQQSYFDFLNDHNKTWQCIFDDDPWAIMYFADMHEKKNAKKVHTLNKFYQDLSVGSLPQFTWIQPSMTGTLSKLPNWQHPDASIREGERMIKDVYESLRNSSVWEDVLFIITYDEHGGFYDHVPPPQQGVPNPDGINNPTNGFDFTRLGVRVPTLAISAHIAKNVVVHEPAEVGKPNATSQFESTSILATSNRILGIEENMTRRDAWAGTFDYLLTDEARQDCPMTLPAVLPAQPYEFALQRSKKLNDHMDIQVSFYCQQNYPETPLEECRESKVLNQGVASDFIIEEAKKFLKQKTLNKL